jgi:hypothetical protein
VMLVIGLKDLRYLLTQVFIMSTENLTFARLVGNILNIVLDGLTRGYLVMNKQKYQKPRRVSWRPNTSQEDKEDGINV